MKKEGLTMEQNLHTPEVYDFRRYDHLWQRVAPGLEPYPAPGQDASARGNPQTPAFDETEAAVPVAAQTNSTSALTPAHTKPESSSIPVIQPIQQIAVSQSQPRMPVPDTKAGSCSKNQCH